MPTDHLAVLKELKARLNAIEFDVACGNLSAAQTFTKVRDAHAAAIALMRGQSEDPFGMALVPLEATPEMLANYEYVRSGADWQRHVAPLTKRQLGRHRKAYAAMLKVVGYPQPIPAQERDDA